MRKYFGYVRVSTTKQGEQGSSLQEQRAAIEAYAARHHLKIFEWFEEQDAAYREAVLPAAVTARVSIEAGVNLTWRPYVGDRGRSVSIEHFGASADYKTLYAKFGITTEAAVAAAKESLAAQ